jgi:hypothetical protein
VTDQSDILSRIFEALHSRRVLPTKMRRPFRPGTESCAELLADCFRLADLPPLTLKGKAQPLRVFQVLNRGQEAERFAEETQLEASEEKGVRGPAHQGRRIRTDRTGPAAGRSRGSNPGLS